MNRFITGYKCDTYICTQLCRYFKSFVKHIDFPHNMKLVFFGQQYVVSYILDRNNRKISND